jgi:hypothetical protein
MALNKNEIATVPFFTTFCELNKTLSLKSWTAQKIRENCLVVWNHLFPDSSNSVDCNAHKSQMALRELGGQHMTI